MKPLFAQDFLHFSSARWSMSKAALAEEAAENLLPMLWLIHLPHSDGGGPAAFAEETSVPTIVGVLIPGGLRLQMLRATKHFVNLILSSKQLNSTSIPRENKFKAAFAEVVSKDIFLVSQQFNRTFRFGDLDNATEPFFQQTRSPPFGAKTPITSGTKVHQDVYDRESRHFAGHINLHPVSRTSGRTTLPKQRWHG